MATLKSIRKSVSEMTNEELRKNVADLRAGRLDKSLGKSKKKPKPKKGATININKLSTEELEAMLKELTDAGIDT